MTSVLERFIEEGFQDIRTALIIRPASPTSPFASRVGPDGVVKVFWLQDYAFQWVYEFLVERGVLKVRDGLVSLAFPYDCRDPDFSFPANDQSLAFFRNVAKAIIKFQDCLPEGEVFEFLAAECGEQIIDEFADDSQESDELKDRSIQAKHRVMENGSADDSQESTELEDLLKKSKWRVDASLAVSNYLRSMGDFNHASKKFTKACQGIRKMFPANSECVVRLDYRTYMVRVDDGGDFDINEMPCI